MNRFSIQRLSYLKHQFEEYLCLTFIARVGKNLQLDNFLETQIFRGVDDGQTDGQIDGPISFILARLPEYGLNYLCVKFGED